LALISLRRAINATDAPGSNDCSTSCRLNSIGKFGRLYAPSAVRALNVLSTLVSTIIWWAPNYPNSLSAVQNGLRELLTRKSGWVRIVFVNSDSDYRHVFRSSRGLPESPIFRHIGGLQPSIAR